MIILTTEVIAGRRIVATLGLVLGLAVQRRGLGGNIMAGLHALGDGEGYSLEDLVGYQACE